MTLNLVGDPSEEFQKVSLFITQVDIRTEGKWRTLSSPGQAFELQAPSDLQRAENREVALARGVQLPKGHYREIRLKVDPVRSSVQRQGQDASVPLALPPALRDGIVLHRAEESKDASIHDLILNVDLGRSLFRSGDPAGGYTFAPSARLCDRKAMGVMTGRILDEQQKPLKGVQVMAQSGEAETGGRTLVRTVRTAQDGTFTLDLLPLNQMYYVVAQPRTGQAVYEARASSGFKPTSLDRRKNMELGSFKPVSAAAGPAGEVKGPTTPDQFDEVELLRELPTGDRTGSFIIRSLRATPASGSSASAYQFDEVPVGGCQVRVRRATLTTDGNSPVWHPLGQHAADVKAAAPRQKLDF